MKHLDCQAIPTDSIKYWGVHQWRKSKKKFDSIEPEPRSLYILSSGKGLSEPEVEGTSERAV